MSTQPAQPIGGANGGHVPVLPAEMLAMLAPRAGGVYLDGTFGGGGWTSAILDAADCTVWAIDRDPDAIARGASIVARYPGRLHLLHGQFGDMAELLGVSSATINARLSEARELLRERLGSSRRGCSKIKASEGNT